MDLELNERLTALLNNDPSRHRYIMKKTFQTATGAYPFDQKTGKYMSYEKLRTVRLNAKFRPTTGDKGNE